MIKGAKRVSFRKQERIIYDPEWWSRVKRVSFFKQGRIIETVQCQKSLIYGPGEPYSWSILAKTSYL